MIIGAGCRCRAGFAVNHFLFLLLLGHTGFFQRKLAARQH